MKLVSLAWQSSLIYGFPRDGVMGGRQGILDRVQQCVPLVLELIRDKVTCLGVKYVKELGNFLIITRI